MAVLQNLLFVSGNAAEFSFAHPPSVKKCGADVPKKVISSSGPTIPRNAGTRPIIEHWDSSARAIVVTNREHFLFLLQTRF
jgi:hypothetical protein